MIYTYLPGLAIRSMRGPGMIILPDQVASAPAQFVGVPFPVQRADGSTRRAVLRDFPPAGDWMASIIA